MTNICQRICANCVKARITGYNHQRKPLYTCRPVKGLPEKMNHLSLSNCRYHESYEERFHEEWDSFTIE